MINQSPMTFWYEKSHCKSSLKVDALHSGAALLASLVCVLSNDETEKQCWSGDQVIAKCKGLDRQACYKCGGTGHLMAECGGDKMVSHL